MKIATFNANSVRVRLDQILDWCAENEPDILAIQETKCEDSKFPIDAFEESGYHATIYGQKAQCGVAIISREPVNQVQRGFPDPTMPSDARLLSATVGGVRLINTYVPNGTKVGIDKWDYKMRWLDTFSEYLTQEIQQFGQVLWVGDINIAPEPIDVYNSERLYGSVGHHPDEFSRLKRITDGRLQDMFRKFNQEPGQFTFWEFVNLRAYAMNLGWRIDHIYATPGLAVKCERCWIDRSLREQERASDHTVVVAEFAL